jgi:hypothetical protein
MRELSFHHRRFSGTTGIGYKHKMREFPIHVDTVLLHRPTNRDRDFPRFQGSPFRLLS